MTEGEQIDVENFQLHHKDKNYYKMGWENKKSHGGSWVISNWIKELIRIKIDKFKGFHENRV